jgi:hypothetical protein
MSTKIEDLPDNNDQVSNQILQELNEDDDESEISEIQVTKKAVVHNSKYDKIVELVKDSLLVFSLVFALSNTYIITAFNKLPYINTLEPHSIIYNLIIALIAAVVHFIVKYLEIL